METNKEVVRYASGDNRDYEFGWSKVVLEYLEKGYCSNENHFTLEVGSTSYQALKRNGITVFYDAFGHTLFEVENDRLKEEYMAMDFGGSEAQSEQAEPKEAEEVEADESSDDSCSQDIEKTDDLEAKEIPEESSKEEKADHEAPASSSGIDEAVSKLQGELNAAKEQYAKPIISHLIERCRNSETLASSVCQPHKVWARCFEYVRRQAQKSARGNCACVEDPVVFEWAEDYYRLDDKALEEKKVEKAKAKEESTKANQQKRSRDAKKSAEEKMKKAESSNTTKTVSEAEKTEAKADKPKKETHKKTNELEGQLDLFSMMGM